MKYASNYNFRLNLKTCDEGLNRISNEIYIYEINLHTFWEINNSALHHELLTLYIDKVQYKYLIFCVEKV